MANIHPGEAEISQHNKFEFELLSDGESDYSIGDVSIITQGESDHDDNVDVEDDGEDATEVDIFQMVWKKLSLLLRILKQSYSAVNWGWRWWSQLWSQYTVQVEAGITQESSIVHTSNEVDTNTTSTSTDGYGYVLAIDNMVMF